VSKRAEGAKKKHPTLATSETREKKNQSAPHCREGGEPEIKEKIDYSEKEAGVEG